MEVLKMNFEAVWSGVLTIAMATVGWLLAARSKQMDEFKAEFQRIAILLNRTREELAKEYVTKAEVHADINRVLDRLERLDEKLDRLMDNKRASN